MTQTWQIHNGSELIELPFESINTITNSELGVYFGGKDGYFFWDYQNKNFNLANKLKFQNIIKLQKTKSDLLALTSDGLLYSLNNDIQAILPLDSIYTNIVDFDATENSIAIATQLSGLFIYDYDKFTHFDTANSALYSNALRFVSWLDNDIYVSGFGGIQKLSGSVFSEVDALSGNQIINQCKGDSSIYFLHENGLQELKKEAAINISLDDVEPTDVRKLVFTGNRLHIVRKAGINALNDNNEWELVLQSKKIDDICSDILIADSLTFISTQNSGLSINHNGYVLPYKRIFTSSMINSIVMSGNTLYGMSGDQVFMLDTVINRLRIIKTMPHQSYGVYDLKCNLNGDLFWMDRRASRNLFTNQEYRLEYGGNLSANVFSFIDPNTQLPAYFYQGVFFNISGFQLKPFRMEFDSRFNKLRSHTTNAKGDVYFLFETRVEKWTAGKNNAYNDQLEPVLKIEQNEFDLIHAIDDNTILLQGQNSTKLFNLYAPRQVLHNEENFFSSNQFVFGNQLGSFMRYDNQNNALITSSTDDFSTISTSYLPDDVMIINATSNHEKIALSSAYKLFITNKVDYLPSKNIDELVVYPNPTSSVCYITTNLELDEKATLTVHNVAGDLSFSKEIKIVSYRDIFDIDLSNYKPGVYFISLKSESLNKTVKITKI